MPDKKVNPRLQSIKPRSLPPRGTGNSQENTHFQPTGLEKGEQWIIRVIGEKNYSRIYCMDREELELENTFIEVVALPPKNVPPKMIGPKV